jgi:hypothetical protein
MKNLFTLLLFSLFLNTAISQTNTFTVYYFDVKPGMESSLADVFDSFYDGVEFKSGGLYLERMHRGDVSGTHRVVAFGELGKFGVADGQKNKSRLGTIHK